MANLKKGRELLRSRSLARWVEESIETLGHTGEGDNGLLLYLTMLSRRLAQPLSACVVSPLSSGKSNLVRVVASMQARDEVEWFSDMSRKALHYMGETALAHKAVIVSEGAGAREVAASLRTLLTEHFLERQTVQGGRPAAVRLRGPVAYVETTTKVPEPELESRMLMLRADTSSEQTGAVQRQMLARAEGERSTGAVGIVAELALEVQHGLYRNIDIVVPFASRIEFPDTHERFRRELKKFLSLIQASAYLHQHQRNCRRAQEPVPKNRVVVEANEEDFRLAKRLMEPLLRANFGKGPNSDEQSVLEALRHSLETQETVGRDEIQQATGIYLRKVHRILDRFEERKYVRRVAGSQGKRVLYEATPLLHGEISISLRPVSNSKMEADHEPAA